MAKLNGVKTVDMVNGEITKVAYEGAEYAKVEKGAAGDIGLVVSAWGDQNFGEYFKIKYFDEHNDKTFANIDGNTCEASCYESDMKYFRKISESKPTLEQRVGQLESDVAALKSGDSSLNGETSVEPKRLTVGDTAKIIGNDSGHFGNIGDIVKIVTDDEDDQPYQCKRLSDGKDVGWFYEEDLVAHVDETIEFEGATYRKVDREAREGDVVIFNGVDSYSTDNGKPYKVVNGRNYVGNTGTGRLVYGWGSKPTVDVYEPIEPAKYVPQEGDIVVVTDDSVSNHALGDIGKITEVGGDAFRVTVPGKKNRSNWLMDFRFRKATSAEVEKYEQAVKATAPKLKAGDFVKFKRSIRDTAAGKPYLIEIDPEDGELSFKDDAGDWCSIERTGEYEILSAEEAKWAKIGRKVNEFKKGDVVKVIKDIGGLPVGTMFTVTSVSGDIISDDSRYRFSYRGGYHAELVAPVESLFKN